MPVSPTIPVRTNGQTIDQTWYNILKSAADDHEDRITALEGETLHIRCPIVGLLDHLTVPYLGLVSGIITQDVRVTGGGIFVIESGSAGTVQIDFQYKRGAGSWTSVFTTQPSKIYSAGNYVSSSNAVVDTLNRDLVVGDLWRLNITTIQTDIRMFHAFLKLIRQA